MSNPFADQNPFANQPSGAGGSYGSSSSASTGYVPPSSTPAASSYDITGGASSSGPDLVSRGAPAPAPAPVPAPAPAASAFSEPVPVAQSAAVFADPKDDMIRQREEELRKREEALHATTAAHIKNFPPCYPIAKNYIDIEIPEAHRWTVRLAFFTYLSSCVTLFWNFLATITVWLAGGSDTDGTAWGFIISLLYFVVGIFFGWSWYKYLYNAVKEDKSRYFVCFFIHIFLHMGFHIVGVVGVPQTFMSGVLWTIDAKDSGKGVIVMCVVSLCMWSFTTLLSLWMLQRAHHDYRYRGIEGFYQMRGDAATAAVQGAAAATWNARAANP